jgi:predicted lipoprotein with Yx(FWY)xxD motif
MIAALHKIAFAFLLMASGLSASAQPAMTGGAIVTREGLSLYTFDNDVAGSGKSVCNAPCSGVFPPYLAGGEDQPNSNFTWITRDDGSKQWAYKGRPLYRFYADEKPGDTAGDGLNRNLWHLARP